MFSDLISIAYVFLTNQHKIWNKYIENKYMK